MSSINRREFNSLLSVGTMGLGIQGFKSLVKDLSPMADQRVGIIGLDTSHVVAFTKTLNDPNAASDVSGYKIVAAYPKGSSTIESSYSRIPRFTDAMKDMDVEIVDSIDQLLQKVDVVLLETNDGKLHLEQALKVFRAGKPIWIDKPIAASFLDVLTIYKASEYYKVPFFTSSSNRYMENVQAARNGKVGKVLGAHTYNAASLEKSHEDFYWYGIHGIEALFTVMGTGCKSVVRVNEENTDVVVGTWEDGRIGTYRGLRNGIQEFGGTAFGSEGNLELASEDTYRPLVAKFVEFFKTGKLPVSPDETKEIYAFMSAADVSKYRGGERVFLDEVITETTEKIGDSYK